MKKKYTSPRFRTILIGPMEYLQSSNQGGYDAARQTTSVNHTVTSSWGNSNQRSDSPWGQD